MRANKSEKTCMPDYRGYTISTENWGGRWTVNYSNLQLSPNSHSSSPYSSQEEAYAAAKAEIDADYRWRGEDHGQN
jgi:hypothetical protein